MTETLDAPVDERDRVICWRLQQLLAAGYADPDASAIADRFDVDLHHAVELVKRGCPAAVAARILL